MEARAILRHTPTSTRKMRLVANLVKGKQVENAKAILGHSPKHASKAVLQTLKSAVSNFMQLNTENPNDESQLYIKRIYVDQGVTLKRIQPAPMGRAYRIRKRANHLTIIVDVLENSTNSNN